MDAPLPKSIEEHRQYLHEIVRLKLWFIQDWLKKHPEETFVHVLRNRVDIYRKTDVNPECINPVTLHWEDPRWQAMEMAADETYHKYADTPGTFEQKAFEIFRPSLDARCQRDFDDISERARYKCGCFTHDGVISPEKYLGFHIANFCQPRSFLDYPSYMKGCFLMLLDQAENLYHATDISTGSWLNSLKRWQAWFPEEWLLNMHAPIMNVHWTYTYWGQFITARGTFNFKYANFLRETGKMPYYPRWSHCSIASMREKLDSIHC